MNDEIPTEHPHIVRKPGTCGGAPIIRGTRMTVRHIAVMWKDGESPAEIVEAFPHLTLSWVYDAISYYLDHRQEIEQEIENNRIENVLIRSGGTMGEDGVVHFPESKVADGR